MPPIDKELVISDDMGAFLLSLNSNTVDESISAHSDKLKADGFDDYLNTVRSQWEAYQKDKKS